MKYLKLKTTRQLNKGTVAQANDMKNKPKHDLTTIIILCTNNCKKYIYIWI